MKKLIILLVFIAIISCKANFLIGSPKQRAIQLLQRKVNDQLNIKNIANVQIKSKIKTMAKQDEDSQAYYLDQSNWSWNSYDPSTFDASSYTRYYFDREQQIWVYVDVNTQQAWCYDSNWNYYDCSWDFFEPHPRYYYLDQSNWSWKVYDPQNFDASNYTRYYFDESLTYWVYIDPANEYASCWDDYGGYWDCTGDYFEIQEQGVEAYYLDPNSYNWVEYNPSEFDASNFTRYYYDLDLKYWVQIDVDYRQAWCWDNYNYWDCTSDYFEPLPEYYYLDTWTYQWEQYDPEEFDATNYTRYYFDESLQYWVNIDPNMRYAWCWDDYDSWDCSNDYFEYTPEYYYLDENTWNWVRYDPATFDASQYDRYYHDLDLGYWVSIYVDSRYAYCWDDYNGWDCTGDFFEILPEYYYMDDQYNWHQYDPQEFDASNYERYFYDPELQYWVYISPQQRYAYCWDNYDSWTCTTDYFEPQDVYFYYDQSSWQWVEYDPNTFNADAFDRYYYEVATGHWTYVSPSQDYAWCWDDYGSSWECSV